MTRKNLNIPFPEANDLGVMLDLPLARREEIVKGLNKLLNIAEKGTPRLVYMSDIIRYIESLCNTDEEFIWAYTNHMQYMYRSGRASTGAVDQMNKIFMFGKPKHL